MVSVAISPTLFLFLPYNAQYIRNSRIHMAWTVSENIQHPHNDVTDVFFTLLDCSSVSCCSSMLRSVSNFTLQAFYSRWKQDWILLRILFIKWNKRLENPTNDDEFKRNDSVIPNATYFSLFPLPSPPPTLPHTHILSRQFTCNAWIVIRRISIQD